MSSIMKEARKTMSLEFNEKTKLSKVLKADEDLLEFFIALNPHDFSRLRNPLMRKLMPPRITLGRIAAMTGRRSSELLAEIDSFLNVKTKRPLKCSHSLPQSPAEKPDWADGIPSRVIDLLASDERLDADPMLPINEATRDLDPGSLIIIMHKWEPQPLYDVWSKMGIAFYAERKSADEVWVYVSKQ
ncbi:MAG: hypothetical protein P1V97_23010 [Planctomycetota bacterium]|nr:hypothetical protein [Planctomycetota bacterium]